MTEGKRLFRDVLLIVAILSAAAWGLLSLDRSLGARLKDRVTSGVATQATVVDAMDIWVPRSSVLRLRVEYSFDGQAYEAPLMWTSRPDRGYTVGDTIEVFVDPEAPEEIATEPAGGSEGWLLMVPVYGGAVIAAVGIAALLLRIQWSRGGKRAGQASAS